jgi:hypothetical protein
MNGSGSERDAQDFALAHMLRGLDRQANVLSDLRQRASVVLSATGIVASLVGAQALQGSYSEALVVLALASTAAGIAVCTAVLWRVQDEGPLPREDDVGNLVGGSRNWYVTISGARLKKIARGERDVSNSELDVLAIIDRLALARRVNHRTLKKRNRLFGAACFLLLLQLLAWAAVLLERA